jgi:hypothetical protein
VIRKEKSEEGRKKKRLKSLKKHFFVFPVGNARIEGPMKDEKFEKL